MGVLYVMHGALPVSSPAPKRLARQAVSLSGSSLRDFGMNILQGFGFLMWRNHPLAGVALVIIVFIYNPWIGLSALLGNVMATLVARYLMRLDPRLIRYGHFGANGMYVALLWAPFLPRELKLIALPLILAALSAPLTFLLTRLLSDKLGLPVIVLPFYLLGWFMWVVLRFLHVTPVATLLIPPRWAAVETGIQSWLPPVLTDLFKGLSQLAFGDSILLGLAILVIWYIGSRRIGFITIVSFAVFWALMRTQSVSPGIKEWAGVNGAMTAFCLGAVFMRPTLSAQAYGLIGGIIAGLFTIFAFPFFTRLSLPILTFPFFTVTVLLLLLPGLPFFRTIALKCRLKRIPLVMVGRPQGFRGEYL